MFARMPRYLSAGRGRVNAEKVEASGLADSVLHPVTPPGIGPAAARVIELDREVRDVRPSVADHEVKVSARGIAPLLTGDGRRRITWLSLTPGKISEPSCAKTSSSTALARCSADVSSGLPQYAPPGGRSVTVTR